MTHQTQPLNPQEIAQTLLDNIELHNGIDYLSQSTLEALATHIVDELSIRAQMAMATRTVH